MNIMMWACVSLGPPRLKVASALAKIKIPKSVGTIWTNFPKSVSILHSLRIHVDLSHAKALHITLGLRNVRSLLCENIGVWGEILKYLPEEAVSKSQPYILLMVEQNKALTNPGGKETCLCMSPWAIPRQQSSCKRGGSFKRGKHDSQLGLPSASTSGPPHTARGAPALTQQVQRCYQPGCISLAPQRRWLLALLMWAVKSMSCVKRKAVEEGGEPATSELWASLWKAFQFPDNMALFTDFSLYRLFHISIFIPEAFHVAVWWKERPDSMDAHRYVNTFTLQKWS